MKKKLFKKASGFTLIEILLVVAAIAVLAGIVIVAINPAKTLAEMRNADRVSDINQIHKAVYQHTINNRGGLDSTILALDADTPTDICKNGGSTDCFDLETLLVPTYLAEMPEDPNVSGSDDLSGYQIIRTAGNRIIVQASSDYVELSQVLAVGGDFVESGGGGGGGGSDTTPPTLVSTSPIDNSSGQNGRRPVLVMTFDENVQAGSGNLYLYNDETLSQTISITSGMVSDNVVTVPSEIIDYLEDEEAYILVDSGAITDTSGNAFPGISSETDWNFTYGTLPEPSYFVVSGLPTDYNGTYTKISGAFDENVGNDVWTNGTKYAVDGDGVGTIGYLVSGTMNGSQLEGITYDYYYTAWEKNLWISYNDFYELGVGIASGSESIAYD